MIEKKGAAEEATRKDVESLEKDTFHYIVSGHSFLMPNACSLRGVI